MKATGIVVDHTVRPRTHEAVTHPQRTSSRPHAGLCIFCRTREAIRQKSCAWCLLQAAIAAGDIEVSR